MNLDNLSQNVSIHPVPKLMELVSDPKLKAQSNREPSEVKVKTLSHKPLLIGGMLIKPRK
jgi:hypothetical protein